MTIRVKNWDRFQHYKNRRPPWIKLYRDLLDDPKWHALSGDASKLLSMCWLIASDMPHLDGTLPDLETLAFRCRFTNKKTAELLSELKHFIICDASDMIASCLQDAIPEGERETEIRDKVSSPTDSHPSGEGDGVLKDPSLLLSSTEELLLVTGQKRKTYVYPADFEEFWQLYPNHIGGKKDGLDKWKKAKKSPQWPGFENLMDSLRAQMDSIVWKKNNGQYIPKAQKWLREGRWDSGQVRRQGESYLEVLRELQEQIDNEEDSR